MKKLMPMAFAAIISLPVIAGIGSVAAADATAQPVNIRGSIDRFHGNTLEVTTREGEDLDIALANGWIVSGVASAQITDIKPGDYVGIASLPMADGSAGALEVLIFPAMMKGTGEGSFGWDLQPNSTMTNATVADAVEGVDGRTVTVSYHGQQKRITIPEGTPVVTFAPATQTDLVRGAAVFVFAQKAADGSVIGQQVIVGTNGVVPPM
ncbi:hypothetical protein [Saccharospirillum mangrovi]|uniref:hypothetical protein n=1 Tax=Saccharospirillum mangrovi TaxID=2161747 RepID=UPI000D3A4BD3|nr:hypothetical protein [Saccharospirillum mangrovi]